MHARLAIRFFQRIVLPLIGLLLPIHPADALAEDGARAWLLLSDAAGAYAETADATLAALPRELQGQIVTPSSEGWAQPIKPGDIVVPLGLKASKTALQLNHHGPVVAGLLPRQAYDALQDNGAAGSAKRNFSALILDQPFERQMALIHQALPRAGKVGVILSKSSTNLKGELAKAASQAGLRLQVETAETPGELFSTQRELLKDNNAVLAIPDSSVLNQSTLMSYLITAYRARVPVFAFSHNLVEAGALAAVYSTPEQIGRQLAEIVADMANNKTAKIGRMIQPRYFKVYVNRQVARSLDLEIAPDDWLQKQLETKAGGAP